MNSQIIPQFVECCAKPTGRLELGEAEHRAIMLLDRSEVAAVGDSLLAVSKNGTVFGPGIRERTADLSSLG